MAGQPTKLTPAVRDRFASYVERGETMRAAARLLGLNPQTPANWVRRGKREPETPWGAFAEAVDVARKAWQAALANEGRFEIEVPPQSAAELNDWIEEKTGVRLPATVMTDGHVSPEEAAWKLFSCQWTDVIVLASRTAGKTLLETLVVIAKLHFFPGFENTHYGAVRVQAGRMYSHYRKAVRREELRDEVLTALKTSSTWRNASYLEIYAATVGNTNGPHPHMTSFDELDSAEDREPYDIASAQPQEYVLNLKEAGAWPLPKRDWRRKFTDKHGVIRLPGQFVSMSARRSRTGLMQQVIDDARDPESDSQAIVVEWDVWDTLAAVTIPKTSPIYRYTDAALRRRLKKAAGWRTLSDLELTKRRMTDAAFEAQVLNRRPEPGALMFASWSAANVSKEAVWKPGEGPLLISYDWGWNDNTSLGFHQLRDGALYRFDEIVGNERSERYWVRQAIERVTLLEGYEGPTIAEWREVWAAGDDAPRRPLPDVWPLAVGDPSAGHMRREWEDHRVEVVDASETKHNRREGFDTFRSAMNADGDVRYFVNAGCADFINCVERYEARKLPDGSYDDLPDPKPTNHRFSHPLDDGRYLVYTYRDDLGLGMAGWFYTRSSVTRDAERAAEGQDQDAAGEGAEAVVDRTTARRIAIVGGPRTGKTTLANEMAEELGLPLIATDDLIGEFSWSALSAEVVRQCAELDEFIVEGVRVAHALRKGLEVDLVLWLDEPKVERTARQERMAKGTATVFAQWRAANDAEDGVPVEEM